MRGLRGISRGGCTVIATLRGALDEAFPVITDAAATACEGRPWKRDEDGAYCPRCGATTGPGGADMRGCAFCHTSRPHWDAITRLAAYDEPVDGWIRAMKFGRRWQWARWFGERLAEAVEAERPTVVCPVPMHWRRRWARGYNQAALMAEALAAAKRWRALPLLVRTRATHPQTAVVPSQRTQNVRGSVAAQPVDLKGVTVVLVDDVKTTGATLGLCARLLRQRGAARIHAAVAAVADPRGQHFQRITPKR